MSARAFVDTNVLVYAHDATAGSKHSRAKRLVEELWNAGNGVISTQVLQELCVNLRRKVKHPLSTREVRLIIEDYLSWEVVVNDKASILEALEIEERFQVSFWDALILQAAESAGVEVLYSEDLSNGQRYHSVRVTDPFVDGQRIG